MDNTDAHRISLAVYLDRHTTRYPIYTASVVILLATMAALPFLFAEVSVGSPGVLRPIATVTPIKAYSAGVVVEIHARENLHVDKGSLLLRVRSAEVEGRLDHARQQLAEVTQLLDDVEQLSSRVGKGSILFNDWMPASTLYQQWLADFRQKYRDSEAQVIKVKRDHERSHILFEGGVIAASEMEVSDETLRQTREVVSRLVQSQLTEWRQAGLKYRTEAADLSKELLESERIEAMGQIVAPVTGTLHQVTGLYPGSLVFSGQEVGYISPDTTLVAEVHVAPGDIGLIKTHQAVRFQVTAYNYNEWGFLPGEVVEVSDDVVASADHAYYIVICKLSREYLQMSGGYRGELRKGMTLQARFVVGRRSLWQLLYDKMDDWLNPSVPDIKI